VWIIFSGCQKEEKKISGIENENIVIQRDRAEYGFVTGEIKVAFVKPNDTIVLYQRYENNGPIYKYKLIYGGNWNDPRKYTHCATTDGFYFPSPLLHSYTHYCGPLNETHYFLDPPRNFCNVDTTYAHMRQHQRVWHHAWDPCLIPHFDLGLWDDFVSFQLNNPGE